MTPDDGQPAVDGDRLIASPQSHDPPPADDRVPRDGGGAPTAGRLNLPKPVIRERHWTRFVIWLVPVAALALGLYYMKKWSTNNGPTITITVSDASSLRPGETPVRSRGVEIGMVKHVALTADLINADVRVQLRKEAMPYARDGAVYWLVKPDFSGGSISGLGTVLSGPYFEASPGNGEAKSAFVAAAEPPNAPIDGLPVRLITPRIKNVDRGTPVNYRGYQVGIVDAVRLAEDGTHVIVRVVVQSRYAPLVRKNSEFWTETPADIKGGIFTGVELKLGSIRQILSGGISFASPDNPLEAAVANEETFLLHDEPSKDWPAWNPKIPIEPGDAMPRAKKPPMGDK